MKKILYHIAIVIPAALLVMSCTRKNPDVPFGCNVDSIVAQAGGGVFSAQLSSGQAWTATTDEPWINVSPANGPSSASCTVSIDSTVVDGTRNGIIRFRNVVTGESRDVNVAQDGFGYNLSVMADDVAIPNYDNMDKRHFDVKVRTNVPFTVDIPSSASKWLSCEVPDFSLDRGARPREVTIRFTYGINSVPLDRQAAISFVPDPLYQTAQSQIQVKQAAAPVITPSHEGDSTVVLSISRNIGMWYGIVQAQPMRDWEQVTLWEETDPGYTPDKKGRVRVARFTLFQTEEEIPYEVQYLTEAEELYFYSNVNSFRFNLELGEHICKLKNLKRLTVSAYGLSTLPQELAQLENLEWLDVSSNNFASVPSVLTPENFPKLHALLLNTCQRYYIMDLNNNVQQDLAGLKGPFPRRLLEWEKLDTLRLSVNYIEGGMPDMEDYPVRYTAQDLKEMNLPPAMEGKPKVLPNAKYFAFNLNRMYGKLPDWVLYHTNLTSWEPYALCYPQEGRATDGTVAGFSNVPVNMDYYWNFYDGYKEHKDIYIGD